MSGAFNFDPDKFLRPDAAPAEVVPLREIPAEWEHGLALLADRSTPRGAGEARWRQVIADALSLSTRYQDAVLAAGWDMPNLFGFDPDQPLGMVGLAVRMRGRLLVSITPEVAVLKGERRYVEHRPLMPYDSPMLWNFREEKPSR